MFFLVELSEAPKVNEKLFYDNASDIVPLFCIQGSD